MKYLFLIIGLSMPTMGILSEEGQEKRQKQAFFTWDLLWAFSWEESKNLHNRVDLRLGFLKPGLVARVQAIDRRTLNFELDSPWGDLSKAISSVSFGLYHKASG
jgi:hypothetical protein